MQRADPALLAALTAGSREATSVLRLGGKDMSAQVESWSLDRSYATDLPPAMRAFNGAASAQLDLTLTGTGGASAPSLYGPWAPRGTGDIARPGQSVTHAWGLGTTALDTFRGHIRSRTAQAGGDTVSLSALDGAERLRSPAKLPRVPVNITGLNAWSPPTQWVASSTWAVSELLRNAGIHTCPPPRARPVFAASLHGGVAPSVGTLESMTGVLAVFSRGSAPHEMCLYAVGLDTAVNYAPAVAAGNRTTGGLWLEGWLNSASNATSDQTFRYRLQYDIGGGNSRFLSFEVNLYTGGVTASFGTSPTHLVNPYVLWHTDSNRTPGTYHFGCWLTFNSAGVPTFTPTLSLNGTELWTGSAQAITAGGGCPPGQLRHVFVGVKNLRAEALQISRMDARPTTLAAVTQTGQWVKGATIGDAVNPLATVPAVSGDTWDAIKDIAKSTLSTAEFDRDGYFRFRDHTRWSIPPTAPDATVSAAREIAGLTVAEEIDACRNDIAVEWQNWSGYAYELAGVSDVPTSPVAIPPGAAISRTMFINEDQADPRCPTMGSSLDGWGNMMIRVNSSSASSLVFGSAEWEVSRVGGLVTVTILNRAASGTVYYHGSNLYAGRPKGGNGVPGTARVTVGDEASKALYGSQNYTHSAGPWIQYAYFATNVGNAILRAGALPAPLLSGVEILADPRLELGDVVRVLDPSGAAPDTLAWVVGIRTEGNRAGIRQTLALRGTRSNGAPADAGLSPDPPIRPGAPPPQ
ncbi:hypothetical protein ACFCWB_27800 [Streptomyces bacillaris]|uniref:hypothetical protein n=1 Tax=Streptomyces bacillaris TaxID=68179 RepID=UPI0035DD58F1